MHICLKNSVMNNMSIMNRQLDVIASLQFNGIKKGNTKNGYRLGHLVNEDYITTGVHHYFGVDEVPPNNVAKRTITFLMPEIYPNCLWGGKKNLDFWRKNIVDYATILEILNSV